MKWSLYITELRVEDGKLIPGGGHISTATDKRIFGRDPKEVIAYLPGSYNDKDFEKVKERGHILAASLDMLAALETARFELLTCKELLKDTPTYQKEIDLSIDKITKAIRRAKGLPELIN